MTVAPAADAPDGVRERGLDRVVRARYSGDGKPFRFSLTIYDMRAEGSAFELVQQSRARPGYIAFHAGRRFCEINAANGASPDAGALAAIAAALEGQLRMQR